MLTDTALRNLKPGAAPYTLADRDGMYVTVSTAGTIAFRYDYRPMRRDPLFKRPNLFFRSRNIVSQIVKEKYPVSELTEILSIC